MRKVGIISAVVAVAAAGALYAAPGVFECSGPAEPAGQIDQLVFARLAQLRIQPVLCSDAVFVRRVYLDLLGKLPTAEEARDFILDANSRIKRANLIEQLLDRKEFADYWSMKWGDVLRIKAEFPVNLWPNAAQAYYRWVHTAIAENKPYDKFARELLTSSGSNFREGPVNFYRAVQNRNAEGIASAVALTFMGTRVESWPKQRLAGMGVFFSQIGYKPTREWKEEDVFWDPYHTSPPPASAGAPAPDANKAKTPTTIPAQTDPIVGMFPDGTTVRLTLDRDPREVFANWLITPRNPWFARCAVNRVWAWLLGRGIIHEPDDIRDNNPPCNPELLAFLEKEFIASKYDMKHLFRIILNSSTYQLTSMVKVNTPEAAANFAYYPLRRLDAEVLIDAVNQITGTSDLYTSPIPEPFTYIPRGVPAVCIADGSITSPFLALFGRSARATGQMNERDNKPVPAQSLHMLNSSHIQSKIEMSPKLRELLETKKKPEEVIEELYLTVLSRFPTPEEMQVAKAYGLPPMPATPEVTTRPSATTKSSKYAKAVPVKPKYVPVKKREDWVDVAWSLINSTEFLYRH